MEQKMLTVPGLAVRNLRHRRVRTMFLAALVLILSAALFTSRVLTESMKTCIDKTVDRIGADVIVAPGEYESDLSDSLFSGGLCSFYFEKSLVDQVKKTDGIAKYWLAFLVVFVIAKVGYSVTLVFYDSMLVTKFLRSSTLHHWMRHAVQFRYRLLLLNRKVILLYSRGCLEAM